MQYPSNMWMYSFTWRNVAPQFLFHYLYIATLELIFFIFLWFTEPNLLQEGGWVLVCAMLQWDGFPRALGSWQERKCSVSPLSLSLLPFVDRSGVGNPEHFQIHVESERWLLSHQIFLQTCGPAFPNQNHHRTGWIQAWLHYEHDSSNGLTTKKLKRSFVLCPCYFLKQYRRKLSQSGALKN